MGGVLLLGITAGASGVVLLLPCLQAHPHSTLSGQVFAQPASLSHGLFGHGRSHLVPCNGVINQVLRDFVLFHPQSFGLCAINFLVQCLLVKLRLFLSPEVQNDSFPRQHLIGSWGLGSDPAESFLGSLVHTDVQSCPPVQLGDVHVIILMSLDVAAGHLQRQGFDGFLDGVNQILSFFGAWGGSFSKMTLKALSPSSLISMDPWVTW